ncbi:MAG: DUF975 family protein [Erysipelotrichaceae bacterium]
MWTRKELKTKAKTNYKKNLWPSVMASLVLLFVSGATNTYYVKQTNNVAVQQGYESTLNAVSDHLVEFIIAVLAVTGVALIIGVLFKIFVLNPVSASCQYFYVENIKNENASYKSIFKGVEKEIWLKLTAAVFMKKLICGLWGLLFVIPGIVKNYQYRFVENLIIENPEMSWREAMKTSKAMTDGQKANMFVLDLSFILWYVLACVPVLGWFVLPYILQTDAELYLTLKK